MDKFSSITRDEVIRISRNFDLSEEKKTPKKKRRKKRGGFLKSGPVKLIDLETQRAEADPGLQPKAMWLRDPRLRQTGERPDDD